MDAISSSRLSLHLGRLVSRRVTIGGFGAGALPWLVDAKKKRRKKKRKKKCGKAGRKPVKGKCCAGSVRVDGVCQRCDVCASGCDFASVQAAIEAAAPGATIAICPGTYRENVTIDLDVRLVGAGDGAGSANTILQGSGTASVVKTSVGNIVLQNLRITGGGGIPDGAGIRNDGATLELIGCTVSKNMGSMSAPDFLGGGIYNSGTLKLTGCVVRENTADIGGGIFSNGGTLSLTDSEISNNTASASGGGIATYQGTVSLDAASRVTGNTANNSGGIHNNLGTVTLASSANVTGNTPDNCGGTDVPQCSG